jgi:S-adenosylhomocysteine hydrolase
MGLIKIMDYDIKDINLAGKGRLRIEWAEMSFKRKTFKGP